MIRLNAFIGSLFLLAASQTCAGTVDNAQRMLNQLEYSIDDEKLRIEGLIYFGEDLINVRLNVPIEQQ